MKIAFAAGKSAALAEKGHGNTGQNYGTNVTDADVSAGSSRKPYVGCVFT